MRAGLTVISSISNEHASQVALAKNNDVVQAFAAKRANESFGYAVLPG